MLNCWCITWPVGFKKNGFLFCTGIISQWLAARKLTRLLSLFGKTQNKLQDMLQDRIVSLIILQDAGQVRCVRPQFDGTLERLKEQDWPLQCIGVTQKGTDSKVMDGNFWKFVCNWGPCDLCVVQSCVTCQPGLLQLRLCTVIQPVTSQHELTFWRRIFFFKF